MKRLIMKKTLIALTLSSALLFACSGGNNPSGSEEDYAFSWVTPTGAPTLAFYDQGENENWVSASNPAEIVVPSFAANSYDAIVFDGVSGLNLMTANAKAANYKLARWINNLGFYLVSTSHTKEDVASWDTSWTIDAFVKTGNASRCLLNLAADSWNWGDVTSQTTFETGLDAVVGNIATGGYDFYVVADPAYTNLKTKMGDKLHLIYDLQEEWGKAHDGSCIPSAALFVNKTKYAEHKSAYDKFLAETDERLANLVDNPQKAQDGLLTYVTSEPSHCVNGNVTKFGISATIAVRLADYQATNTFGFLKKDAVGDVKAVADKFQAGFSGASFSADLFLTD